MSTFAIRPLAIVACAAMTVLAAVPAQALTCKSTRITAKSHKAVLKTSALVAARTAWRAGAVAKYGAIWGAYRLCRGRSESLHKSGLRWRATVSCRPCRP